MMKHILIPICALCISISIIAQQTEPLFYESFDKCINNDELYDGFTGGNDNLWSGNIATEIVVFTDNNDWTFDNVFGANQCIKLGTASLQGKAVTPAIKHSGDATLTFRAAPWNEEKNFSVTVDVKGGTADKTSFTLEKHWNDLTVQITDITESVTVTFSTGAKKQRIFLDEIRLTPADPNAGAIRVTGGTTVDFGYVGQNYGALTREIQIKGVNISAAGITASIENDADNLFSVSPSTLPAEGGTLTISCKSGASSDTHGAYLMLRGTDKNDASKQVEKRVTLVMEVSTLNLQGCGTLEDPYTISDRLLLAENDGTVWSGTFYWVTGYVLGAVKRYNDSFDGICTDDNTSLVIAANADETDMDRIVTVQIGKEAREALNVVDNPDIIGKRVKVQGTLLTDKGSPLYLGKPGVRDVNYKSQYVILDGSTGLPVVNEFNADEMMYDILGRPVDSDYQGIIIQNGRKYLKR